jgi:hypothetical protein
VASEASPELVQAPATSDSVEAHVNDALKAFQLSNDLLRCPQQARMTIGYPGATSRISAKGTSNGIVWMLETDPYASSGPAL